MADSADTTVESTLCVDWLVLKVRANQSVRPLPRWRRPPYVAPLTAKFKKTTHLFFFMKIPKPTMPTSTATTITKRPKQAQSCHYASYECMQFCLEGYLYCAKHILEDSTAPYKPCAFVYNSNGRKCQNPAPKLDRRDVSYCSEHSRKAQIARIKLTSRCSLPETPEMLLLNLSHYVKPTDSSAEDTEEERGKVKALDPFTEVDAYRVNASGSDILDYASSSESDVEPTVVTDTLRGVYLDDSDNESLHSPQEDPLK
ncbi:KAT8 regulatory NSL complex subunit 2-like isoform X2 [Temnothorax nylanderi]